MTAALGPLRRVAATLAVIGSACAAGCGHAAAPAPGEPLPGLSATDLARFARGKTLFDHVFTPAEGLGPVFNENQCSACHTDPSSGGTGEQRVVKATRFDGRVCDRLENDGGLNVRRQATPALRAFGVDGETIPAMATAHGRFKPPFLFGAGLVEAITDSEILRHADPDDRDRDGISGRAGRAADGRVGRFGRKAEFATLPDFVSSALRLEMGLTTALESSEPGVNGRPLPAGVDPAPDPEIDAATLEALTDYVRLLAPLAPETPPTAASRDSARRGERLFRAWGCASCHVPTMTTGRSRTPALDRKTVHLYSDLLLHDMGSALADICGIAAAPSELRTEPLAGLRYRKVFLHDGRALSVREAIRLHGGEATAARDAFATSDPLTQRYLLRFLDTI